MFEFLKIKTHTVAKTAFLIAFFTIMSAFFAVVRDKILASKFGASEVLDIYVAAFKIPDLVFLMCATLISSFIIIPFLEEAERDETTSVKEFVQKLFYSFLVFILFVSSCIFFFMPQLADFFFSGFGELQLEAVVNYARILLLAPIFMGLSFVFSAVNQKNEYFLPMALTGLFYNLSIIFGIIFLYPFFGFHGIIGGVVLGASLFLLLNTPPILQEGLLPTKVSFFKWENIRRILKISIPRSVALVLADLVLIFVIAQATFLGEGSVTILNFSLNIFLVPVSMIAISYSVAVFPKLAVEFFDQKYETFKETSTDIISRIMFFGIPVSFFFFFYSADLVGLLLGSEKFGLAEIYLTGFFVSILSVAIVFQAFSVMTVRIFYAMGKTWLPFLANIITGSILISLFYFLQSIPLEQIGSWVSLVIGEMSLITERNIGIGILVFSYAVAFIVGSLFTNFFFKISFVKMKKFSLMRDASIFSKIGVSLVAAGFSKLSLIAMEIPIENSFLTFFINLLIGGIIFLAVFVIISEVFPDKNYSDLRKKLLVIFKNNFLKGDKI